MKTFYGISLFLLCFIVSYGDALAVDFTIKTNIMRTYTETITPAPASSPASCSSISSTTLPAPMTLTMQVVDSDIVEFTVRVVEKDNPSVVRRGASTHDITGGNFNLSNGQLTHTITGIPSMKKVLVAQLFKGTDTTVTPYFQQEISTARGTKVQSGVITIGDLGNDSDDFSLPGALGVITGGSKDSDANTSTVTVNIDTQEDNNYVVMVTVQSLGNADNDNSIEPPVITSKSTNSFTLFFRELATVTQNIRLNVMIQGYQ